MKKRSKKQFSTRVIDDFFKEKLVLNEERRQQIIKRVFSALTELSKGVAFDEAYIFGSLTAKNEFKRLSDVDIGFFGLKNESVIFVEAFLSRYLGIEVDVLRLEDSKFRDKILKGGLKWKREK